MKKLLRPAIFAAFGAIAGLVYYNTVGCGGSCVIAASPLRSAVYLGIVGLLLAFATARESARKEG